MDTADLDLAIELADLADEVTLPRFFSRDFSVATKPDDTPVTDADRATERVLRDRLAACRPEDAILGEEYGTSVEDVRRAPRLWVIDPIDGTKNYLRGVPVWATLIAVVEDGYPRTAVVSAPALGRRWYASPDTGAWVRVLDQSPQRLRVSGVDTLTEASLAFSSLAGWEAMGRLDNFVDLTRQCWRTRGYGDFWSYMMVAEGIVDIAAEPELETYDMAALVPIVEGAGGCFTSLDGHPGPWGGNAVATNGHLHHAVRRVLGFVGDVPIEQGTMGNDGGGVA